MFTTGVAVVCVAGIAWAMYMKYKADNKYWAEFVLVALELKYPPGEPEEEIRKRYAIWNYYSDHPEIPTPQEVIDAKAVARRRSQQSLAYAAKHVPFYCFRIRRRLLHILRSRKEQATKEL